MRPLIRGHRTVLTRRVRQYAKVARAIAVKLSQWCPERLDDCVQEGLTAACGVNLDGVRNPDAYIRQCMKFRMISYLRREAGLEQRVEGRRSLGLETYRDDIPSTVWGDDPDEAYYEDRVHRDDPVRGGADVRYGLAPANVDDRIDCDRLLGRLADRDRTLMELVYGLRPVPGHAKPGPAPLRHVAALMGWESEGNVRYHRDRILRQLRTPARAP